MSTKTKKQSFIEEALHQLCDCALQFGFDERNLNIFEELAIEYLKESFKNGLKAAYRKQAQDRRKEEPKDR